MGLCQLKPLLEGAPIGFGLFQLQHTGVQLLDHGKGVLLDCIKAAFQLVPLLTTPGGQVRKGILGGVDPIVRTDNKCGTLCFKLFFSTGFCVSLIMENSMGYFMEHGLGRLNLTEPGANDDALLFKATVGSGVSRPTVQMDFAQRPQLSTLTPKTRE